MRNFQTLWTVTSGKLLPTEGKKKEKRGYNKPKRPTCSDNRAVQHESTSEYSCPHIPLIRWLSLFFRPPSSLLSICSFSVRILCCLDNDICSLSSIAFWLCSTGCRKRLHWSNDAGIMQTRASVIAALDSTSHNGNGIGTSEDQGQEPGGGDGW